MKSPQPDEHRSDGVRGQPIVVLDVDSNRPSQLVRQRILTEAEFRVHRAAEASQALEAAATHQPDVVLLNWKVADLCRPLKAGPGNIPIVALLMPSSKAAAEAAVCGADLRLPKRLAPAFLIEALKTLLRVKKAERELQRSREELVDFSVQLAHDIEGPLRGVVTFAELIGEAHPLSEKERTYLGHVLSSADQARRVARGVLTYAEAQRARPRLNGVSLHSVVMAALQALSKPIKESAAVIQVQEPLPSTLGDFSALQQVIQNLIDNAISYRRRDTGLFIAIGARRESSGHWLISVSDNGCGIAKQYHKTIFAPFKRLHGLEIPGAGMGLAICKEIVESHGGWIWVESEPECGASFLFTLKGSG